MRTIKRTLLLSVTMLGFGSPALAADAKPTPLAINTAKHDGPVDFEKEILPILRRKCLACHNATDAESDLVLETPASILKGGSEGPAAIAGKADTSLLLMVAAHQKDPIMPPKGNKVGAKNLTGDELGLLKLWIDEGAKGEVKGANAPLAWQQLPPGVNPIYSIAVSPRGDIVAAGRANQIFIYNSGSKKLQGRLTDPALIQQGIYKTPGVADLDLVQSLAFSPDGSLLASGGFRSIKIWQRPTNPKRSDLAGIESNVKSLVVSKDGKLAAIGEENGKIRLFELATGKLLHTLSAHSGAVTALCFAADASLLLSGSQDKTAHLWNVADGKDLGAVTAPAPIGGVCFTGHTKMIATGCADNNIYTWNAPGAGDTAKPVKELKGHTGPVLALAANPAAAGEIISGSQDGSVKTWDFNGAKVAKTFQHGAPVTAIDVNTNGQRITSAGGNLSKIWNNQNGQAIVDLKGDLRAMAKVDNLTRTSTLAGQNAANIKKDLDEAQKRKKSEEDNSKKNVETKAKAETDMKAKQEAAKKPVADKEAADKELEPLKAAFAKLEEPKAKAAADLMAADAALKKANEDAAAAKDDNAKKAAKEAVDKATANRKLADDAKKKIDADYTMQMGKVKQAEDKVKQLSMPAQKALDDKLSAERAFEAATRSIERSAESIKTVTAEIADLEKLTKEADEASKKLTADLAAAQKDLAAPGKGISGIAISPDDSLIVTAGEDQNLYLWAGDSGATQPPQAVPLEIYAGQPVKISHVAVGGNAIVSAGEKSVVVWDVQPEWKLLRTIGTANSSEQIIDRVTALDFSPDGKTLASGGGEPSRSGELKLWNVETGMLLKEIKDAHSDTIFCVAFSPDGKQIASCGADRFAKVFDVATAKHVRSYEGHTHHVLGVAWKADGRTLVTSGADNAIKVWDARTGDQKKTIQGFKKEVTSVQFMGTGDTFLVSAGDAQITSRKPDGGGGTGNFTGATDFVFCARASLDGKIVAAGGQDSIVRVWNDKGGIIASFEAPKPPEEKKPEEPKK